MLAGSNTATTKKPQKPPNPTTPLRQTFSLVMNSVLERSWSFKECKLQLLGFYFFSCMGITFVLNTGQSRPRDAAVRMGQFKVLPISNTALPNLCVLAFTNVRFCHHRMKTSQESQKLMPRGRNP